MSCPACYTAGVYCRRCKTWHCGCTWSQCATPRMVQQQVILDPEQRDQLRALSARTRIPQSVFVREGIEAILAREEMRHRTGVENTEES